MNIILNSPYIQTSLVDGPGVRGVLFLQGCNLKCPYCHNKATWNIEDGKVYDVLEVIEILKTNIRNKKITISGGEPLLQKEALLYMFDIIKDWDICLYTGYNLEDVPKDILKYLRYIKVGNFIEELRTTNTPFIGSSNQKFINLGDYYE